MTEKEISIGRNDWRDQLISELNRTGGDPSILFEVLEAIIESRAWETLLDTKGKPVGSLRRLLEAAPPTGSGQSTEKILKLLDIEHRYEKKNIEWHRRMANLRASVKSELGITEDTRIDELTTDRESIQKAMIPIDVPELTAKALKHYMREEDFQRLIQILTEFGTQ